eukprot:CAMPEP_0182480454 /NCGR_PEP_ID=MMETSP1319-20130603/35783_1 /TAXON_ID=172717 /ORGANISM="Bolidomonas pacifica, Strain RCC208" /LENGTH=46 /DNA_ID= /DNA_START= /DNA_END= /DNA_ORIENTATION=
MPPGRLKRLMLDTTNPGDVQIASIPSFLNSAPAAKLIIRSNALVAA